MTVSPRLFSPVGTVDSATVFVWSTVPGADRYGIRLFDGDGTLVWQHETADTVALLPSAIGLRSELTYFWKVEAQSGFDRRAASDLVEFSLQRGRRP